jgi:hypothetical protein
VRLLCLHAQTIKALASLHAPFDDLTPDGLWGSEYHLIGITQAQRDVLSGWGIELEDITPEKLGASGRSENQRSASSRPAPSAPRGAELRREEAQPAREPARAPEQPESRPSAAPERGKVSSQPATSAPSGRGDGGVATRAPMKLRTRLKGKYKEAFVQEGKIHLDGQKYDSPLHASKSLAPDKRDWELWEYYDEDAGKWYMLDREWETA